MLSWKRPWSPNFGARFCGQFATKFLLISRKLRTSAGLPDGAAAPAAEPRPSAAQATPRTSSFFIRRSLSVVAVPLVEQLLGGLDDRGDDAGPADDVPRRADGTVADLARDRADLEGELRCAGQSVAPLVHRRRACVCGLAAPGDARALHP